MNKSPFFVIALISLLSLTCETTPASEVKLHQNDVGQWQLLVDNAPFIIKGIGRFNQLQLAQDIGVNTIRSYSSSKYDEVMKNMADAEQYGFKVIRGLWLQREGKGFSYNNLDDIAKQRETIRNQVREWKEHKSIILWGLGNEAEGSRTHQLHPEFWTELGILAELIKQEDPDHPVMTVIAGMAKWKIKAIQQYAPAIDIIGINAYGAAPNIPTVLDDCNWQKPFILTEFGSRGHWEVAKTAWDAPIEPSSQAKAANYLRGFRGVSADTARCLGTVCFVWAAKQEITNTWYGMFLDSGEKTPAVDAIASCYTEKPLLNLSPRIVELTCDLAEKIVKPEQLFQAKVIADDPEDDQLSYEWKIIRESGVQWREGDSEPVPPEFPECFTLGNNTAEVEFITPKQNSAYRLQVIIRDGQGGGATQNVPFKVEK